MAQSIIATTAMPYKHTLCLYDFFYMADHYFSHTIMLCEIKQPVFMCLPPLTPTKYLFEHRNRL